MSQRSGSTLLELIVTLAVMAVVAGVVALAARPRPSPDAEQRALIDDAARRSLRTRKPVTVEINVDGKLARATFFPDGRAVGDTILGLDHLSGALTHAR